jgi:hypothetical protein
VLVVALFWCDSVRNVIDQGLFFANKMSCSVVRLSHMGVCACLCAGVDRVLFCI